MRRPELRDGPVDLLKIDVERAELAVLRGVQPEDWPRIRQVSMEVHDVDGQLQRVLDVLQTQGKFEQARQARGTGRSIISSPCVTTLYLHCDLMLMCEMPAFCLLSMCVPAQVTAVQPRVFEGSTLWHVYCVRGGGGGGGG